MSKVRTFSRQFPAYHPKKGEPTFFVEKMFNSILWDTDGMDFDLGEAINEFYEKSPDDCKHHTIREGSNFKAGDLFSPRVWSGKPYRSHQINFAPDVEVKKVWDFEIVYLKTGDRTAAPFFFINKKEVEDLSVVAKNDGLEEKDFIAWFLKPNQKFIVNIPVFSGQIICWNESINY